MNRSTLRTILAATVVFIVAVLPFARSSQYGIVNCDDYDYVAHARAEGGLWDVREAIWMPLTWASYKLDLVISRTVCSRSVEPSKKPSRFETRDMSDCEYKIMHVHSILVHGLNAVLLFLFLMSLSEKTGEGNVLACLVAALLWAVHPLRCESVCWIASRKDVLSMLCLLAALMAWIQRPGRWAVPLSLIFFLFGMACKPSVMVLGPLVLVLDWLILQQFDLIEDAKALCRRGVAEVDRMKKYAVYLPPLVLCGALAYFAAWAQACGGAMDLGGGLPLQARVVNAVAAFGIYVKNEVWPMDLSALTYYRWPDMPRFWWQGIILCVTWISSVAWMFWKGRRGNLLGGMAWYAMAVVPFLGLKAFGSEPFADRFSYIPAVGFSLMLLPLLRSHGVHLACGCVAVVLVGMQTVRQSEYWRDDGALFARCLEVDGEKHAEAWANLGLWHFEYGHDLVKAKSCFEKALKLNGPLTGRVYPTYFFTVWELRDQDLMRQVHMDYAEWDSAFISKRHLRRQGISATRGYLMVHALYLTRDAETREAGVLALRDLETKFPTCGEVKYALYLAGAIPAAQVMAADCTDYVRYRFLGGALRRDML